MPAGKKNDPNFRISWWILARTSTQNLEAI
jgi:hypothetical protein